MAIPSTNVNLIADVANQLWGNIGVTVVKSLKNLGLTANGVAPHAMSEFYGITAALSRAQTSWQFTGSGQTHVFTITANVAWKVTIPANSYFSISAISGKLILAGSGVTAIVGGTGSFTCSRSGTAGAGQSQTVTLTYANGVGATATLSFILTTTF